MSKENKTLDDATKGVGYLKAGWINMSRSGKALTWKHEENFYSVPIGAVKELLEGKKSGAQFSRVIAPEG